MSEGASVDSGLVVVIVVKLGSDGPTVNLLTPAVPTATPSITYSGWLSPLVEVAPRICTEIAPPGDRKSTRLNSSHSQISYAVFCLKKQTATHTENATHLARAALADGQAQVAEGAAAAA